ncbi:MAG: hypothetical protein ACP5NE_03885 [Candidatus Micrarchaeia archaeon]
MKIEKIAALQHLEGIRSLVTKISIDEDEKLAHYVPRTSFLKKKIAEAHFGNEKEKAYIYSLCMAEEYILYRCGIDHNTLLNSFYSLQHSPKYNGYRKEYFEMLRELSYKDWIEEVAGEIFIPGEASTKPRNAFKLEDFNEKDRKEILKWKGHRDRQFKLEKRSLHKKAQKAQESLRQWWIANGGKA